MPPWCTCTEVEQPVYWWLSLLVLNFHGKLEGTAVGARVFHPLLPCTLISSDLKCCSQTLVVPFFTSNTPLFSSLLTATSHCCLQAFFIREVEETKACTFPKSIKKRSLTEGNTAILAPLSLCFRGCQIDL